MKANVNFIFSSWRGFRRISGLMILKLMYYKLFKAENGSLWKNKANIKLFLICRLLYF